MTVGERFIQQGIQQGIQQAFEGQRRTLLYQLHQRFGDAVSSDTERCVAAASVEQIEIWARRVLSAATLSELLAD